MHNISSHFYARVRQALTMTKLSRWLATQNDKVWSLGPYHVLTDYLASTTNPGSKDSFEVQSGYVDGQYTVGRHTRPFFDEHGPWLVKFLEYCRQDWKDKGFVNKHDCLQSLDIIYQKQKEENDAKPSNKEWVAKHGGNR